MRDPVFNVGDKVTPLYTSGYHLTIGKVYEVVKFDPPFLKIPSRGPPTWSFWTILAS